jgi:hypothetical protein
MTAMSFLEDIEAAARDAEAADGFGLSNFSSA